MRPSLRLHYLGTAKASTNGWQRAKLHLTLSQRDMTPQGMKGLPPPHVLRSSVRVVIASIGISVIYHAMPMLPLLNEDEVHASIFCKHSTRSW